MAIFHDLQIQRLDLLNELEDLEASVAELAAVLDKALACDADELTDHRERLAWLHHQHAGVLTILSETERALLEFGMDE